MMHRHPYYLHHLICNQSPIENVETCSQFTKRYDKRQDVQLRGCECKQSAPLYVNVNDQAKIHLHGYHIINPRIGVDYKRLAVSKRPQHHEEVKGSLTDHWYLFSYKHLSELAGHLCNLEQPGS
jgi:hypothetical protein